MVEEVGVGDRDFSYLRGEVHNSHLPLQINNRTTGIEYIGTTKGNSSHQLILPFTPILLVLCEAKCAGKDFNCVVQVLTAASPFQLQLII